MKKPVLAKILGFEVCIRVLRDVLLLTLPEAQALTGLSREFLCDAINQGTLKAKMIGRS